MPPLFAFFVAALTALPVWAVELVMVDQPGCVYCARWEAEIGPIYPKTSEGRFAPLRRVNIRDVQEDVDLKRRVVFTPTFLVVEDGAELIRLEGYPGMDFFWPLLDEILRETTDYIGETP
ncbi:hypothetical protein [Sulfitobacter sp. SK011]|uniref:hypothetical protein n=1 Tax=Sulfitobacter sp. SK011 TaxID=1389004 RepID=UPI000E0B56CB|nr:hypothetical protein [Sulfitobacter sp. SK011]AXI42122.1 hypothetical protein C1J02_09355 [Sulfitobacter sp. SK011]